MLIRSLEIFRAVVDTGSFSAAAERLHTVQSNVTAHIKKLETELDARLLERRTPVVPTPAGRQLLSYAPRAPSTQVEGRIVSVYGNAVQFAAQNQVVAINKGTRDGIDSGHVLAILKNGETILDRTGEKKETIKLPNERIGLLMVFRPFEKVSYALVLEINDTPRAGDFIVNP